MRRREAAPRHRAEAEAVGRRGALEPRHERELVVGRRERRGDVLEPARRDLVERADLEQRRGDDGDPGGEQQHRERERGDDLAAALMPPHRHRRGDERAGAVAGDQQRPHVARHDIAATRTPTTNAQRPGIAHEREPAGPRARQPLGQRRAAQEEEPGGADDQPDPAELGRELAHVGEGEAEGEHGQRRRGDDGEARASARPKRRAARRAASPTIESVQAKRARERRRTNSITDSDQHRQPEMALVIEREVAVAGVAVERQVEQQQPADAGREHEPGVADARAHRLRAPAARARRLRDAATTAGRRRRAARTTHERRRRAGPGELGARRREAVRAGERPRHARQPSGRGPDDERDAGAERRPARAAGSRARTRSRSPSPPPTAARRCAAARASHRSCAR